MNKIRLGLAITALLAFLALQILPMVLLQRPQFPPQDFVPQTVHVDDQISKFREQLPREEVVGYRLIAKDPTKLDVLQVSGDVMRIKFAIAPSLMNEKPEARQLPKRIINNNGELSYKDTP